MHAQFLMESINTHVPTNSSIAKQNIKKNTKDIYGTPINPSCSMTLYQKICLSYTNRNENLYMANSANAWAIYRP